MCILNSFVTIYVLQFQSTAQCSPFLSAQQVNKHLQVSLLFLSVKFMICYRNLPSISTLNTCTDSKTPYIFMNIRISIW